MRLFSPGETFPPARFGISGATGAATNADATPTLGVYRNGILDSGVSVTVLNPATGEYSFTFVIPGGYALGDVVSVRATATVAGIVLAPQELVSFRLDNRVSTRAVAGDAMALTAGERTTLSGVVKTAIEAAGSSLDTLISRLTAARAGYLDKLNVAGLVASQGDVLNVGNNTRIATTIPMALERPDAGSENLTITISLYDDMGNMEVPDATPTVALVNRAGTNLAARLSALANPSAGTYTFTYVNGSADALEQLLWTVTVIEGGATRTYSAMTQLVDTTAADFTAGDRATLATIQALTDALPLLSEIRADIERVGGPLLATQASSNTAANQATAAAADALAAKTRVELALPNAASNTSNGLPIKSNLPGAAPTVAEIADAVWDEALSGHSTAGSAGKALADAAVSTSSSFAVLGMKLVIDGQDCDCETLPRLTVRKGDNRDVVLWVVDEDGRHLPIPSDVTPTLVDPTGSEVDSAELTDIKAPIGYLKIRVAIPTTGTMPASLVLLFDGGAGARWTWEVLLTVA